MWYTFFSFRYAAICHPMQVSLHSGKRKTFLTIVLIWIICLIPSFAWTHFSHVSFKRLQFPFYSPGQNFFPFLFFLLMPLGIPNSMVHIIQSFSRGIQGVCNWDGILDCSAIYWVLCRIFNAKLEISCSNKKKRRPFLIFLENSNIFPYFTHVLKVWQYHETSLTSRETLQFPFLSI